MNSARRGQFLCRLCFADFAAGPFKRYRSARHVIIGIGEAPPRCVRCDVPWQRGVMVYGAEPITPPVSAAFSR